ncbi:MAG TPA: DNA-processing protein DprA, partial [Tepidisphaeraceae bacterium]|nr:DNA-processing protein DprA [Tepidisphaeraceae bacterium]
MSKLAWLRIALTDGLGPVLSARLIEASGSVDAACDASLKLLKSIEGIGSKRAETIHQSLIASRDGAVRELEQADKLGVKIVSLSEQDYPTLLKSIPAAPPVLWTRGEFLDRDMNGIGIVGSRKCSVYGREQSERFGAGLAGIGMTIVSGGARGVDTHAHRGAMIPANGRTIAVLGCGVDIAYPPENEKLLAQITERGAVVSDFPLNTPPVAENFPRRNRLISGLARGVLVIEADVKSGALITARYANEEHNRPVFAIPGRVDNPLSAGPHRLIRDGAKLVECADDNL